MWVNVGDKRAAVVAQAQRRVQPHDRVGVWGEADAGDAEG